MLSTNLKQLKKCCNNCRNYNGDDCRVITCKHPHTKNDPDNFYCAYFKRTTPLIVTGMNIGIDCLNAIKNKLSDACDNSTYTVRKEDIKEGK